MPEKPAAPKPAGLNYRPEGKQMKLGITGLPQTGKKLIFNLLTGAPASSDRQGTIAGMAEIKDGRFDRLADMFKPKKEVRARLDLLLLPEFNGANLSRLADADALCHVVRAFEDEAVYHVSGSVNPKRDIEAVNSELMLHDMLFIEKRMERIAHEKRARDEKRLREEEDLLSAFREHLEKDKPLRTYGAVSAEQAKITASYPFLTQKPLLIVLNTGETLSVSEELAGLCADTGADIISVPAKLEYEIARLDSAEERQEFMADAGIEESALERLSALAMKSLGLHSFFTVGKDEVRQWLIKRTASAPEAAGAVHSDIQRGFIRAEVIKYDDLTALGSEEEVKKAGRLQVMGKDYIVEDGDIISFRFNV